MEMVISARAPYSLMTWLYKWARHLTIGVRQEAAFWLRLHDRSLLERFDRGFAAEGLPESTHDHNGEQVLRRVLAAYERAKRDQGRAPKEYAVGPMWEGVIERNFGELLAAVERKNTASALRMLESFHRRQFALGAGGGYDDYLAFQQNPLYRYQFINTWVRYVRAFESIGGREEELAFPQVGQPVGMATGTGIIPLEAIRYHYWARRFHLLLEDVQRPVVCEIGGGLGGQAFKALTNARSGTRYVVFDIPETLLVASYFLLRSLPESRVLLYGEGDLDQNAVEKFDLVLMPNFELPKLPERSVDLWFNACSFSEMLRETAEEYLHQVERTCRKYFLHVNHTVQFQWVLDGKEYHNLPADQLIPNPTRFKLVERKSRPFGRIEDRRFLRHHGATHEVYLYRKIA